MAGLRVGYGLAPADLAQKLKKHRMTWFNSLSVRAAVAAYEDEAYFQKTRAAVIATREKLTQGLVALGFDVVPSAANFVFARHPKHDAGALMQALRERSIIVRHFRLPRIDAYLRITVGTDDECAALLDALGDLVG